MQKYSPLNWFYRAITPPSSSKTVSGIWVVTRVITILLVFIRQSALTGDFGYYYRSIAQLPKFGWQETLIEYPMPLAALLWPLAKLPNLLLFDIALILCLLLLDAAFTYMLFRQEKTGTRAYYGTYFWLLAVPLSGPIFFLRTDILSSIPVGMALLILVRHPRISGVLLAIGTAFKLWPLALLGPLTVYWRKFWPALTGFLIGFGVLMGTSWLAVGTARMLSPMGWASDRGLQIEALPATPIMANRYFNPEQYWVGVSAFNAFEVLGPGVQEVLSASRVYTLIAVVILIALWVRGVLALPLMDEIAKQRLFMWLSLATVLLIIASEKTFSPQYWTWVLPIVAVLLLQERSRLGKMVAYASLLVAFLTYLVFPLLYTGITARSWSQNPLTSFATPVLVARNFFVLIICFVAVWALWRMTKKSRVIEMVQSRSGK